MGTKLVQKGEERLKKRKKRKIRSVPMDSWSSANGTIPWIWSSGKANPSGQRSSQDTVSVWQVFEPDLEQKREGERRKLKKKKSQLEAIQGQQVPNWDRGRVWFPCAPGQSQHCPKSIIRGVPGGSSLPAREQLLIQTKQGNSIQLFQSPQRTWTSGCQSLQFGRAGRSPQKERTEIPSHFPASMLWEAPSLWIGWVFFT